MGKRVAKFGGTSLASAEQIRKCVDIIAAHPDRRFVVVSAPGKRHDSDAKVTDLLYQLYEQRGGDYSSILAAIRTRFTQIADELDVSDKVDFDSEFTEIESNLTGDAGIDYFASRGEALNALVIAAHLGWTYVDAADVIRFDETGVFLDEETQALLSNTLAQYERAVIPGFYGATASGVVKTFSRGGSDVTGALVARATQSSVYENWTDVSGILMADPRIVETPEPIARISYGALRQLTYLGASVLHENAIYPVRQVGIPTHIRNTNRPDDPGTWIQSEPFAGGSLEEASPPPPHKIVGLAGRANCQGLTVRKVQWSGSLGVGAQLLQLFDEARIPVDLIVTGVDSWTFIFRGDASALKTVMEKIQLLGPDSIDIHPSLALIGIVATGSVPRAKIATEIFQALSQAGIGVQVDSAAESMQVVGVDAVRYQDAVRAIYSALV
ncbi:MAG: aspartate kinase [Propionibacteriaceae bacterium]|jgi:aspartate kinase|nr:aspartate kinase [Propionibacteriaceae bacterium]